MRKIDRLRSLSEGDLREQVIVPLLGRMGFRAVGTYHGTREHGKDVVAFDIDRLGRRWYLGVVAKTGDLTGAVSGNRSLREVVYQVQQCFDIPYRDLYGMAEVTMDKVWVCTAGNVIPGAADSVYETLSKYNLTKMVRFISGSDLIRLLDEYHPGFWGETESIDALREQRDRALEFIRRLLSTMGTESSDVSRLQDSLINGTYIPSVTLGGARKIIRATPFSIDLEPTAQTLSPIYSFQCGWLHEQYLNARRRLSDALNEVEEVIYKYDEVVKAETAEEFLAKFDALLAGEHPFHRPVFGDAAEAVADIGSLEDGLHDVRLFERALDARGQLSWAWRAFEALLEAEPDIEPVLRSFGGKEFVVYWTEKSEDPILRPGYTATEAARLISSCKTSVDERVPFSRETRTRRVTAKEVIAEAGARLRQQLEAEIGFRWEEWE